MSRDTLARVWYDQPDPLTAALIRADMLEEYGQCEEAELIRLSLVADQSDSDVRTRVRTLQTALGLKQNKVITRRVPDGRTVNTFKQLVLTNPLGLEYMCATLRTEDIIFFSEDIKSNPVIKLRLLCHQINDVQKYLECVWLRKIAIIEFNNWNLSFSDLPRLFERSEINPQIIIFSGHQNHRPSIGAVKLMRLATPAFKYVKQMQFGPDVFKLAELGEIERFNFQ